MTNVLRQKRKGRATLSIFGYKRNFNLRPMPPINTHITSIILNKNTHL